MTPETIHALKRAEAAERELRRLELALQQANKEVKELTEVREMSEPFRCLTEGAGI